MGYDDDPVDYEKRLREKLQPESIRATLAFAAIYQMANEMTRRSVVERVRDFYCLGFEADGSMSPEDEDQYRTHVLQLVPKNQFRASLRWLVQSNAVTQTQADRLTDIYAHRNALTHELIRFIIDPDSNPDVQLLADSLAILKGLNRFWVDIELSTGGFGSIEDTEDVDPDSIVPLELAILQQCIDACVDGLRSSGGIPNAQDSTAV